MRRDDETTGPLRPLGTGWRRLRRTVLARRRLLAALLAALAVVATVRATSLPPTPTAPLLVARADLPAGRTLRVADLATVRLPTDAVPDGAAGPADLDHVAGRTLAAPVRRGEAVTDLRLVSPGLLEGYPGRVAVPVRVADPGAVRLLRVGDRIDLLGTAPDGTATTTVVSAAPVVALPRAARGDDGLLGGALVVLAVPEGTQTLVARAAVASVLSVTLRR